MHETPYQREAGYALRYRDRRFTVGSGGYTDRRERMALRALLQQTDWPAGPWLDAPAGAGRMSAELPGPTVQLDRDRTMLVAAGGGQPRVCASSHALPFANDTFAGALCHRLLQHIPTPAERIDILRELARVCRGPIVVSFFDACSLQHLRRVVRRWSGKHRSGRSAVGRASFLAECRSAGLQPVAVHALRRFVAEQTLVLCHRLPRSGGPPHPRDPERR